MRDMDRHPPKMFTAAPLDNNLFEWHFTIKGPSDTPYEGGLYHGRILLPPNYPHKPPDVVFLTANGRFKTNEKICLSITGFHPEHWSAVWDIRAALTALIAFMPSPPNGAIGSLDYSNEERVRLARKSPYFRCPICKMTNQELAPEGEESGNKNDADSKTSSVDTKSSKEEVTNDKKAQPTNSDPEDSKGDDSQLNSRQSDHSDKKYAMEKEESKVEFKSSADSDKTAKTMRVGDDWMSIVIVLLAVLIAVLLMRRYGRHRHGFEGART
uniref:UBC core domain-containing protein n=1 Tax=Amorphochlora amoebiformis TaxID=1561963 RepID=A0A7S0DPL5_9EUKA